MAFRLHPFSPVAWVTIEKLTQQILWLAVFAILAPILGPGPYGLFSIVMVFVGFCEFVLSEGAVEALVSVEELDHRHVATANLANGVIALLLSVVLVLVAPVIGMIFHDAEIKWLIWTLTPLPVLSLLSAVPIAVLRRSLQYKRLALRSIVALAVGGAVGIALAIAGAGVWALALQVLVQRTIEVLIAWISVPVRVSFGWSGRHFREMSTVGANVFAARVMIFAGGQLPRLILGYALGPAQVGLFTLANRFLDIIVFTTVFPRTAVGRIELRNLRPGSGEFVRTFAGMAQDVSLLSLPILLGTAAIMPDVFGVWLDQRWSAGLVPAQFVVLSGVPLVLFYCFDSAFLAAKLSSVFKRMATIQAVTTMATVACVAPFGLEPTCLALAIRPWALFPLYVWALRRRCHVPGYGFLWPPLRSLLGAVAMGALLNLAFVRTSWGHPKLNIFGLIGIGILIYAAFAYSFSRRQLKAFLAGLFAYRP